MLSLGQYAYATCPYPAINDITHEYYIFEDTDYIGIGWEGIPEGQWDDFDRLITKNKYRKASDPYLIDKTVIMTTVSLLIVGGLFLIRKGRHTRL